MRPFTGHTDESRPLHGIPILLRDEIATMDEMNNTGRIYPVVVHGRAS